MIRNLNLASMILLKWFFKQNSTFKNARFLIFSKIIFSLMSKWLYCYCNYVRLCFYFRTFLIIIRLISLDILQEHPSYHRNTDKIWIIENYEKPNWNDECQIIYRFRRRSANIFIFQALVELFCFHFRLLIFDLISFWI